MTKSSVNQLANYIMDKFEGQNIIADVSGTLSTLKFINRLDCYIAGANDDFLFIDGEDEDHVSLKAADIKCWYVDPINDEQIVVELKKGIAIVLYEQ